jgi:hypothetical protein
VLFESSMVRPPRNELCGSYHDQTHSCSAGRDLPARDTKKAATKSVAAFAMDDRAGTARQLPQNDRKLLELRLVTLAKVIFVLSESWIEVDPPATVAVARAAVTAFAP